MKFILSMILWLVPMLTPYGLQIGVVQTNNKTIRIMKMNLNNPAFLQSAGNVKSINETRFVFNNGFNSVVLSANGSVDIVSIQSGVKVRERYNNLNETKVVINSDAGTEVFIYGDVTEFKSNDEYGFDNTIRSLDVSNNIALTQLYCTGCSSLTSLDLSNNIALTQLDCNACSGLTSLDLSNNIALTQLNLSSCDGLTSLDLSNNIALTQLNCPYCSGLTSLDLSNNTALTWLDCSSCSGLTSLDLSNNTALTQLYCTGCSGLTSLDLSNNIALTQLNLSSCDGLTSLDLSNNIALTQLNCSYCSGLTSLDLSNNTALTSLTAERCDQMTSLDIQNTQYLAEGYVLSASMSRLKTLRVAGTSEWSYDQVNTWLRGLAPQNGTILVDENTPEDVITSATTKNWTVEYVDAA